MEIEEEILKKIPFFNGLSEEHLGLLKKIITVKEFAEGTEVIKEGKIGEETAGSEAVQEQLVSSQTK